MQSNHVTHFSLGGHHDCEKARKTQDFLGDYNYRTGLSAPYHWQWCTATTVCISFSVTSKCACWQLTLSFHAIKTTKPQAQLTIACHIGSDKNIVKTVSCCLWCKKICTHIHPPSSPIKFSSFMIMPVSNWLERPISIYKPFFLLKLLSKVVSFSSRLNSLAF